MVPPSLAVLLDCAEEKGFGNGCDGGEWSDVFEYMLQEGLPDETCSNYRAESAKKCTKQHLCQNCMMKGRDSLPHCWAVEKYVKYYVTAYSVVSGEAAMMTEILARGPITCGVAVPDDFCFGYTGGVWHDKTNSSDIDHDVVITGVRTHARTYFRIVLCARASERATRKKVKDASNANNNQR